MIDNLNLEISEWKVVEDRVDGIIPLEVDDVGPTLSAISNDLLLSCYGPRFTVKINTQDLMVNGKDLKETFEIMVYDAERNEIKPLRKMSPGERVWIEGTITTAGIFSMPADRDSTSLLGLLTKRTEPFRTTKSSSTSL